MRKAWQKALFRLRERVDAMLFCPARKVYWGLQGARFGSRVTIGRLFMTWPHQVEIGARCILERNTTFKFDGVWAEGPSIHIGEGVFIGAGCEFNIQKGIRVGADCAIASGCRFVDHDHGTALGGARDAVAGPEGEIVLEEEVWLGANVVVLKGVTIGKGAVVGAGAVVTKAVPAFEIWGGVPAKKIGARR